jgi:plastocyanin
LAPGKSTPAKTGEVIVLYGSGFGQSAPPVPEGQVVNSPSTLLTTPVILINGTPAEVLFAGLTATGLYQINIRVPAGIASGDARIIAEAGGVRSPDGVFIAIEGPQPAPAPPSMPDPIYSAAVDNFQFIPANINVAVGGKLTWTNKQAVEHTVRSDSGVFGSAVLGEGDAFSFTFASPGTYAYHCSIHPFMKGMVVVQ